MCIWCFLAPTSIMAASETAHPTLRICSAVNFSVSRSASRWSRNAPRTQLSENRRGVLRTLDYKNTPKTGGVWVGWVVGRVEADPQTLQGLGRSEPFNSHRGWAKIVRTTWKPWETIVVAFQDTIHSIRKSAMANLYAEVECLFDLSDSIPPGCAALHGSGVAEVQDAARSQVKPAGHLLACDASSLR